MGGSAEKQHKKARAANARLAREAKRANTSSNSTPEESQPVTSDLPDPPTDSVKSHLQQLRIPSSAAPRHNPSSSAAARCNPSSSATARCNPSSLATARRDPSRSRSGSAAPSIGSHPSAAETRPSHKMALAAQSLLEQVQLEMDYDSKEDSDSIAEIEGDDDGSSDGLLAESDVEICAPSNKKSTTFSAPRAPAKTTQVQSANQSADKDEDEDGTFLCLILCIFFNL